MTAPPPSHARTRDKNPQSVPLRFEIRVQDGRDKDKEALTAFIFLVRPVHAVLLPVTPPGNGNALLAFAGELFFGAGLVACGRGKNTATIRRASSNAWPEATELPLRFAASER